MNQNSRKIELCDYTTNPLMDPYFDFVKDVMIETLLSEVEHEVHWRLIEVMKTQKDPKIAILMDSKTGRRLESRHLPYCKCEKCDSIILKKLRSQNRSPYHYWRLSSKIIYLDEKTKKHLQFCRCFKCQKKPIFKLIRTVQETGREKLRKSEFTRVELNEKDPNYDPEIFDVRIWKDGLIDWAVEAIEKRSTKHYS